MPNPIDDLLRKLEPILKDKTKAYWFFNLLNDDSKSSISNLELLKLITDKKAKLNYQEVIRLPPPIDKEKMMGEYKLGDVLYPETTYGEFGLREAEFIRHILIVGMTGTGKTNLSFQLLKQLKQQNKPFLVFDWKKTYRDLKQLPEFKDLEIIRIADEKCDFKFNPLIPPKGVNPKHWLAMLIDVMKHAFYVGHGVEYFLRKGIDYLYDRFGIYEGKTRYPKFSDLELLLKKEYTRGREVLWMSAVKRVLAVLTFSGLLGEVLNVRQHKGIDKLLNKSVIIELDNLSTTEKIFFIESLLLWIYEYRKLESTREKFKHAIIIEEAHHILSGMKETQAGEETIVETIIRMIREFGESIIVIDQEPSKLSKSILANTNCKICFTLGSGHDVATIAKAMNLTKEEERYIDKLKIGKAIVKLKERFDNPIHIQIPLIKIDKGKFAVGYP